FNGQTLAGRPRALDELHDANVQTPSERPQRKPERRGRVALAGAVVNDVQTLFENWVRGDLGVLNGLALGHFGSVPFSVFGHVGCREGAGMVRLRRLPLGVGQRKSGGSAASYQA